MRIRLLGARTALILCTALVAAALAGPAEGQIVNIDIEGDPPNDTTHSGADGVLSGGGSVWNGVPTGVDTPGLVDELGFATGFDVDFTSTGGGSTDSNSTNDLQDSGTVRFFDVTGLAQTVTYDVAIYAFPSSFIRFTDSTGGQLLSCTGSPTYALPGTIDEDYCLFEDRLPADLGGGQFGFKFEPFDGVISGVQIGQELGDPPPTVPALPRLGMAGLLAALLGASAWAMRRR